MNSLIGVEPPRPGGSVIRERGWLGTLRARGLIAAVRRLPTWAVSLFFTLRLLLAAAVALSLPIVAERYFGRPWHYVAFCFVWFLVIWGYVHAKHEERRQGMPRTRTLTGVVRTDVRTPSSDQPGR